MAARKWTDEQHQAAAIRTWAPRAKLTGPRTSAGLAVLSKNAFNSTCCELLHEMTRQNRVRIAFINAMRPAPTRSLTTINRLLVKAFAAVEELAEEQAAASAVNCRGNV